MSRLAYIHLLMNCVINILLFIAEKLIDFVIFHNLFQWKIALLL